MILTFTLISTITTSLTIAIEYDGADNAGDEYHEFETGDKNDNNSLNKDCLVLT